MAIKLVTLSMRCYGQLNQNRIYMKTPELGMTESELATHIRDNWVVWYKNLMVHDVLIFNINVRSVGNQQNLSVNLPVAVFGANTPESQRAPFSTWVIQLDTGLGGRKFRGRIYAPGHRAGDFQEGIITGQGVAAAEAVLTNLNELYTAHGQNDGPIIVIHGEGAEPHDTEVTTMRMRSTLGCQRRRNIGVGQ